MHRYYLEPASPLKSITNTAQLAPSQKQQQTQLNSATLTNGTAKSIEENSNNLWASNATVNGKSSNNRWKMDLLSSNDNSSLFNNHISAPVATNGIRSNGSTANNSNGPLTNGLSLNGNKAKDVITKNGFIHLPPPGSNVDNNNLFTPDTDFVADFSSANIFDALNNKPSINKSSSTNKATLLQAPTNGNHSNGVTLTNGTNGFAATDVNKNVDENFADFEHNTIYNAAGELIIGSKTTKMAVPPGNNRYDMQNQSLFEIQNFIPNVNDPHNNQSIVLCSTFRPVRAEKKEMKKRKKRKAQRSYKKQFFSS